MLCCAVLALLGAVALCPAAQGRSAVIGLSGDDTRHGIAVLYGNLGGKQVELTRYHVETLIQTRFASTVIEVEIRNNGPAQNATVPFAIPEQAMLVTFEIDDSNGKVHQARPMLRADLVVDSANTSSTIKARNAEAFDVDIELAGSGSVVLRVVYEELLTRKSEKYANVQQIWPGEAVEDLKLSVRIKESSPINSVNYTFTTESANSVVTAQLDQLVSVVNVSDSEVLLTLQPTVRQQHELAVSLGLNSEVGAAGQFNVEYDVARYPTAGDIVVRDGYFAHFFAPTDLQAIPKYALFMLDVSGSMDGRKIHQLSDAMVTILGQLGSDDVFTVIEFSDSYSMWDLGSSPYQCNVYSSQFIPLAQQRAKQMSASGGTYMLQGLQQAIACAAASPSGREPILVMLTDGIASESSDQIQSDTAASNSPNGDPDDLVTSIFTLALGDDADEAFLREMALRNGGKFQHVYEAEDASQELQKFYETISSPLLTNVTVTFNYTQAVESSVTQKDFRTYFWGSELVVAGRLLPGQGDTLSGLVTATGHGGKAVTYPIQVNAQPSWQPQLLGGQANSERLWAFLYTKQHLDQEVLDGPTSAAANASIDMALEYSFVTPHTCLAVDIINPYQASTAPPQPATASPASSPPTPASPSSPSAPTRLPSPSTPTRLPSPSTPAGPPGPPGPATPPTPGNSDGRNIINIGSISVGSMTVKGPLIQFNLR